MGRTRTSTSVRLLSIAVLVMVWGLTTSRPPAGDGPAHPVSARAVMPLLVPTLFAQTIISGCTNGDVNSGNEINITVTTVRGRTTDDPLTPAVETQEVVTFDSNSRTVNLVGATGSVANVFLNGVQIQPSWVGLYDQLLVTVSSQMNFLGAVQCVTGGETRYYYSNGSTVSSPFVTSSLANAHTLKSSTAVDFGGGEFPMNVSYRITQSGITLDVKFDPTIAVYGVGGNNVVFPSVNVTFGSIS